MKIIITRAFERTKQVAQFEPIKAFCSASMELEDIAKPIAEFIHDITRISVQLDAIVRAEVENTIRAEVEARIPACVKCGGKQLFGGKGLDASGKCTACR